MSFETGEWSLAKDKELIDKLEKRSAEFRAPLSEIPGNLDQLTTETAQLNLLFQNVIGDLNTLSERRFIENRVAEAHDEKRPLTPEPEVKPATDDQLREAVRTGLKAFGLLPVEELNDDDDRETGYECFARDRPFSLIIGSKRWLEADPFEGITPVDTVSVGGTPISEAMEDLVLPSTSPMGDDVEEATEAEAWYQKERASISTQGEIRALDSDSESSVISAAPRKSTLPPLLTDLAGPSKPRGLFDEDSDDDGDLFGVSREPSSSSLTRRGSRSSVSRPTQLSESRKESVVSLQQETVSNEPKSTPGPVSFLDELKKKTGQRNPSDQQDVKSPLTPTVPTGGETLPSPSRPQQAKQPPAQRKESIFDSDPESDIFAVKPSKPSVPDSNPRSRSGSSLPNFAENRRLSSDTRQSEQVVSNARSKKPSLLDSDSEEEAFPKDVRKQSLPKITSPLGSGANQILPKLPKKNSLFDDSDSDSDIFGPPKGTTQKVAEKPQPSEPILEAEEQAQAVKPKEFKGVRVLPLIPAKAKEKEGGKATKTPKPKLDSTAPDSKRSQTAFASLESVVKPQTSESEDEEVKPIAKPPAATRPQLLPAKLPNLFGDSDSDDDLFGAPPVIQKTTAVKKADKTPEIIAKKLEVPLAAKPSDPLESISPPEKSDHKPRSGSLKAQTSDRVASEDRHEEHQLPAAKHSEAADSSQKPPPKQSRESKTEEKPAVKKSNIFSTDSESDEDLLPKLSLPTIAKAAASKTDSDLIDSIQPSGQVPEGPQTPEQGARPLTDDLRHTSVETRRGIIESLSPESSESTLPVDKQEPVKTMAEKTSTVKKIGMGLPAGLLQGLKARQQQLGIAQPEPKRNESSPSESKTPDAQAPKIPQSSGGSGLVAMKSDHKDIVEIAKNRVKGPTGRRLPTRQACIKKSETAPSSGKDESQAVTAESAQIKSEVAEEKQSIPETSESDHPAEKVEQTISKKPEPVTQPPPSPPEQLPVQNPLSVNSEQTEEPISANTTDSMESTEARKPASVPAIRQEQEEKAKPSRQKSKSIFASDSSDEDLFAPKAPPRRKSLPKEPAAELQSIAKSSIPAGKDPLSAAFAAVNEPNDEAVQPVAPKRATKTTLQTEKVETPKTTTAQTAATTQSKSLFSDSEDDDDGLLFGSKKIKALPKSATTSSLSSVKDKAKLTQSKSASSNLFGSDSDSDELFKRK